MISCTDCRKDSVFCVQWGPANDQKDYVCDIHLSDLLQRINGVEFFVIKIEKVEK